LRKLAVMMGRGITGPYKISCFSPGVSLVKSMVVALCILVSAPSAQAGPMPPFMVFYDAGTGAAFGAVSAGFSSSATFGSEGWLEEKEELLTPDLNEMMEEMGKEMAAEAVSDYKTR